MQQVPTIFGKMPLDSGKTVQQMQEIGKDLLKKYLAGECSAEKERQVEAWLLDGKSDSKALKKSMAPLDRKSLKEGIWQELKSVQPFGDSQRKVPAKVLSIAAVLILLLTTTVFIHQYWKGPFTLAQDIAYETFSTGMMQKMDIELPDGSHIVLNSASQLRFPKKFRAGERRVELHGEAFLRVAKDASRPFTVIAPGTEIQVLGTRFDVKAYGDDITNTIVVEEGKVGVSQKETGEHIILSKGEMCAWNRENGGLIKQQTDTEQYVAWTRGNLIFKDRSLAEMAPILERWYGVEIFIGNDRLREHRFTGSFGQNPPLLDVIQGMALTMQFHYTLEENKLLLE